MEVMKRSSASPRPWTRDPRCRDRHLRPSGGGCPPPGGELSGHSEVRPARKMAGVDIDALETSFDLVAPKGDELMEIFYSNLFAVAPSVRPMFAGTDMARQKAMLLSALALLRKSLRDLDRVLPTLKGLGA